MPPKNDFAFARLKEFVALPMEGKMSFRVLASETSSTLNAMKVRLSRTKARMRAEGMMTSIFLMSIVSVTPVSVNGEQYEEVVLRKRSTLKTKFNRAMRDLDDLPLLEEKVEN